MTAPVAHATKISADAPSATAAFSERRRGRLGVVARPGAGSEPGAPVSAGLEAGSDSAGCGMENAKAMRASDARTTEARSDFNGPSPSGWPSQRASDARLRPRIRRESGARFSPDRLILRRPRRFVATWAVTSLTWIGGHADCAPFQVGDFLDGALGGDREHEDVALIGGGEDLGLEPLQPVRSERLGARERERDGPARCPAPGTSPS